MTTNNPEYMRAYYHNRRLEVIKLLGGKCAICGSETLEDLDIHHKNGYKGAFARPNERGGWQQLGDVIKTVKEGRADELELQCYMHNRNHWGAQ